MFDLKFLRHNLSEAKEILKKRNVDINLDELVSLDKKRSELIQRIEKLREERNKVSKSFSEDNKKKGIRIKEELKKLEPELEKISGGLKNLLNSLPNTLDPHTPIGIDEKDYKELKKWGTPPAFDFQPLDHVELGKKLDIIDFEKGAKVSGSQFYFLKDDAVFLEHALMQFAFDILKEEGFKFMETPDLAKIAVLDGIGFQPRGPESQIYKVEDEDLGLIATAEVTIGGYHKDEILNEKDLPLKYAGISHCFRREAGGYGRYSRGLYRVHQFTKVEMFIYCLPDESPQYHDYLLSIEEKIYQKLEIPYRVVDIVSGDLGAPAVRKFDIEAWMPGKKEYGEITSTSNCTDYQASRLNIKFRQKDGTTQYVHMLNGTALAISRTLIAIIENYQKSDGKISIPKVLQSYMKKNTIG